jgi:hypothetical protein
MRRRNQHSEQDERALQLLRVEFLGEPNNCHLLPVIALCIQNEGICFGRDDFIPRVCEVYRFVSCVVDRVSFPGVTADSLLAVWKVEIGLWASGYTVMDAHAAR